MVFEPLAHRSPLGRERLKDRRLEWLQRDPKTRYSRRGVIAIDNTLVEHSGKLIEDVGWFWDHADQRYLIAYDYLISNYVCASGAHYPIEWRRFRKKDACVDGQFKDHTELCIELIEDAITRDIPGDFTFDSYFTHRSLILETSSKIWKFSFQRDNEVNTDGTFLSRLELWWQIVDQLSPKMGESCN